MPLGSSWSLTASGGYQELNNATFRNTRSWRVQGGIAKMIGHHMSISGQYIYFQYPANLVLVSSADYAQNGVTVSLSWMPSTYQ